MPTLHLATISASNFMYSSLGTKRRTCNAPWRHVFTTKMNVPD